MPHLAPRPHPTLHALARSAIRPTVEAALRGDVAGAEVPGVDAAVTW
ncbi:hypothetical protein [Streptomyces sp. NPDC102283]